MTEATLRDQLIEAARSHEGDKAAGIKEMARILAEGLFAQTSSARIIGIEKTQEQIIARIKRIEERLELLKTTEKKEDSDV